MIGGEINDQDQTDHGRSPGRRFRGVRQELADDSELPAGYTLELAGALAEETGEQEQVLLVRRSDGTVAWVFAFDARHPTVEEVERRVWEDHRATGGRRN